MTANPVTKPTAPCGFCATGTCGLCPETVRQGSNAASGPIWTCPCFTAGHTIPGQPARSAVVVRLDPAVLDQVRADRAAVTATPAPRAEPLAPRPAAVGGAVAVAGKVTACDECGYEFRAPQSRRTCKAPAACARRQAARVAA
jgi:hypothetical protein